MGGLRSLGRGEPVSPDHRLQTDSGSHGGVEDPEPIQSGCCQTEKGVVKWGTRESLLSTELRAFPPVTGLPLTFLTSSDTYRQWTADGKWLVFRGVRETGSQAFAVNEETGRIVQETETGFSGMMCLSNKAMKLYVLAGGGGGGRGPSGPRQILEVDLAKLFADVEAKTVKPSANYTRVCGTIPATLQVDGNMGLDANDEYMYFRVQGPETAELSPGQTLLPAFGPRFRQATSGLRSMNLKTGEIKFIVNVGFGIGHVQSNPWMPGEIVFCWETGGKAPQRTWIVNADGTGLRPLYPEAPYEWITHEAVISKDEA